MCNIYIYWKTLEIRKDDNKCCGWEMATLSVQWLFLLVCGALAPAVAFAVGGLQRGNDLYVPLFPSHFESLWVRVFHGMIGQLEVL